MVWERIVQLEQDLETASRAITAGASVTQDWSMRSVTYMTGVLNRHMPDAATNRCRQDGHRWPCADIEALLEFAGAEDGDEG